MLHTRVDINLKIIQDFMTVASMWILQNDICVSIVSSVAFLAWKLPGLQTPSPTAFVSVLSLHSLSAKSDEAAIHAELAELMISPGMTMMTLLGYAKSGNDVSIRCILSPTK